MWERLGNVLKSYINDGVEKLFSEDRPWRSHGDDDFNAAYEELDDFLRGDKSGDSGGNYHERDRSQGGRAVPVELRRDFAELGLSPGASEEECKEAYKKLLKIHHPDRHGGGDPELMKKATEKTARINAANDRLVTWFKAGGMHY